MADNTRGGSADATLPLIATDDVGGIQYQRIKLDIGGDGLTVPIIGSGGAVPVGSRSAVVTVTPTLDTAAYASGDTLATAILTFASTAFNVGGTGYVESLIVIDADLQSAAGELWLFSTSVTPAAANAAHSISDANALVCIGVIPFGPYYASALNSVSVAKGVGLAFKCDASLAGFYGIAVTRGTPTHTASGLTFRLTVSQD